MNGLSHSESRDRRWLMLPTTKSKGEFDNNARVAT